MGNERVARETMAWVKQWDWCVFGKKKGKKRPRQGDENFDTEDEYHRPREKVPTMTYLFVCVFNIA
jgi:chromosome transmission fidelity protein 18